MKIPAKRFLNRLSILDKRIQDKREEASRLLEAAKGTGMRPADPNRVQASHGNTMEDAMIRYVDINKEIDARVIRYMEAMDETINMIHALDDARYERLLFLRYVPDENHHVNTLEDVARIMAYSYDHTVHLHGQALNEFRKKHSDKVL